LRRVAVIERLAACVLDSLALKVGLVAETAIRVGRGIAVLINVVAIVLIAEFGAAPTEGRIAKAVAMRCGQGVLRTER